MNKKSTVSVILSVLSIVGVGLTAYFCKKETPDADMAIDEEVTRRKHQAEENGVEPEEMTLVEKVKVVAPHYKKTIMAAGGTVICIASGQIVAITAISGALASAYAWQHRYLNLDAELRKKAMEIKDKVGEDIRKEIKKEAAKKDIEQNPKTAKAAKKIAKKEHKQMNAIDINEPFDVFDDISGHLITVTRYRAQCIEDWINNRLAKGEAASVYEYLRQFGVSDKVIKDSDTISEYRDKGWDYASKESAELFDKNDSGIMVKIIFDYIRTEDESGNTCDDIPLMYVSVPPAQLDGDRYYYGKCGLDPMKV